MANRRRERRETDAGRRPRSRGERKRAGSSPGADGGFSFTPLSLAVGGGGLVLAVVAFSLVARGDITIAPLLMVVAYLVLFPIALVMRGGGIRGG